METTIIKISDRITSNESKDLVNGVLNAIEVINNRIKEKGWIGSKIKDTFEHLLPLVANMTLNQRKKLKNKINGCIHRKSIRSINTFIHFYIRHVLKNNGEIPYVKVSEKEEQIQIKRKEWVKARNIAQSALDSYKKEKGDFYK